MEEPSDIEMSLDDVPNVKAFTAKIVQRWRESLQDGSLTSTKFEELWKVWVPKIYSPAINESCLNWNFNEELAQEILINTLDEFICDGDPNVVFKQLSEMDKAPSVRYTILIGHVVILKVL